MIAVYQEHAGADGRCSGVGVGTGERQRAGSHFGMARCALAIHDGSRKQSAAVFSADGIGARLHGEHVVGVRIGWQRVCDFGRIRIEGAGRGGADLCSVNSRLEPKRHGLEPQTHAAVTTPRCGNAE
jgi:hypothetical protein